MLRPPRARLSVRPGGAAAVAPTGRVDTGLRITTGRLAVTINLRPMVDRVHSAGLEDGFCEASDSRALTTFMIAKGAIHQVESATVRDRNGVSVGKVVQVFRSHEDGSAAYLCVATGLLGRHQALVPADDATFNGTDVHVGYTKDAIKRAPSLGAERTLSPAEANAVRKHFGLPRAGAATGDMGDPHENLDQAGTVPAGADETEGAGTSPPA